MGCHGIWVGFRNADAQRSEMDHSTLSTPLVSIVMYVAVTQQIGGFGVCLHTGNKPSTHSNAVKVCLPPVLGYLSFTYVSKSLSMSWVRNGPESCVRSRQKFHGEEEEKNWDKSRL